MYEQQPNYLTTQPLQISNTLANVEGIKGARLNNQLAGQQIEQNDLITQFRQAVAMGDMNTAMRLDPAATTELMEKRLTLQAAQQEQATAQAKQVQGITSMFSGDLSDAEVMQLAPIAIEQLQALGMGEGLTINDDTTADRIRELVDEANQQIAPYIDPPKWTGGQSGIDPHSGNPIVYQTDQHGNTRINPDVLPTPSKGLSVTTSDGTVIEYGANTGGGMQKGTAKSLEESIIATSNSLDRLSRMGTEFEQDYLTVPGKVRSKLLWGQGMLDPDGMNTGDRDWYSKQVTWRADAISFMNEEIKRMTGAQMSENEAKRLRKGMPDPENDDPIAFQAKWKSNVRNLQMIRARANYYLSKGLQPPNGNGNWVISINEMEQIMKERAETLTNAYMAQYEPKEARHRAMQQANEEFYK